MLLIGLFAVAILVALAQIVLSAGPAVDIGTGTSITFSSGFFARILNIDFDEFQRAALETSHMGLAAPSAGTFGNKTFIPGDLSDPGGIDVEIHLNPDTLPPIDAASGAFTITFPSGATWAGNGFMTGFKPTVPLEGVMTAKCKLKFTGPVTRTAAP